MTAEELLKMDIEYPGHPIVLGCLITMLYPSLKEASKTGKQFPAALEDRRIPGAGGNVYAALDFLRKIFLLSWEKAVFIADLQWSGCDDQEKKNPTRWRRGKEQADLVKEELQERLKTWK